MKIGLLSDTHKKEERSQEVIDLLCAQGAEFLIHAGDIVKPENLDQLKQSGLRYVAVYGNNDPHLHAYQNKFNLVQEPHYFKLANTKFKLMHLPFYMNADTEVVIFGHTHMFECDFKNGTLFINPGEACARNNKKIECAMLEVTPEAFRVSYYSRPVEYDRFEVQYFTFERIRS